MTFQRGDRVRWASIGDDGFPIVRYGFIGSDPGDDARVVVMLDGDLKGDTVVDLSQLAAVTITNIELRLEGADLLEDPSLRQGLVSLWSAEADQAGLEVGAIHLLGTGVRDIAGAGFALAELRTGDQRYVLRARCEIDIVCVKADTPQRSELA